MYDTHVAYWKTTERSFRTVFSTSQAAVRSVAAEIACWFSDFDVKQRYFSSKWHWYRNL